MEDKCRESNKNVRRTNAWIGHQTKVTDILQRIAQFKWQLALVEDNRWTRGILTWRLGETKRSTAGR